MSLILNLCLRGKLYAFIYDQLVTGTLTCVFNITFSLFIDLLLSLLLKINYIVIARIVSMID